MVMITTSLDRMNELIGRRLSAKEYEDIAFKYGLDLDVDGNVLNFEITSDRTDLMSVFTLAKLIKRILGKKIDEKGIIFENSDITVEKTERPFVNCLLLRMKRPLGDLVDELISLQEKMDQVVGRKRRFAACGFFDADKISFPITYSYSRKEDRIIPLGFSEPKDFDFVLKSTQQGIDYGGLIKKPIVWRDRNGEVIAMPPIINSDKFSLTRATRNVFIDITGTDRSSVNLFTKILIENLGEIGSVSVLRPKYKEKEINTNLSFDGKIFFLNSENIENVTGMKIPLDEAEKLLSKAGFSVKKEKDHLRVYSPYYRQDVIHQVDLVDDIIRMYGVDLLGIDEKRSYIKAMKSRYYHITEMIRDQMVGLGFQETDLNVLTSERYQFELTGLKAEDYVRIVSSRSNLNTMVRKNIFPEGIRFISNNLNKRFPQNIFDIGYVVELDRNADTHFSNRLKLMAMQCGADADLTFMIQSLKILMRNVFGKEISIDEENDSPFLIDGRRGSVILDGKSIGIIGEVHPSVLNKFGVNMPISMFEIYL